MRSRRLTRIGGWGAMLATLAISFSAAGPVEAAEVSVTMVDDAFVAPTITIQPGDRVTWYNRGAHGHTITSDRGLWDSGTVAGTVARGGGTYGGGSASSGSSVGQAYWVQFHQAGTYSYICRFHTAQGMRGTVVVGQPQTAASSSSPAVPPPLFYPFRPRTAGE